MKSNYIFVIIVFHMISMLDLIESDMNMLYPLNIGPMVSSFRPPSIASRHIYDKLRAKISNSFGPQRRIFFPFNRLFLSLIAPRLMRLQFDLMLHSFISEMLRKVVLPIIQSLTDTRIRTPMIKDASTSTPTAPFNVQQIIAKTQQAILQQGQSIRNALQSPITQSGMSGMSGITPSSIDNMKPQILMPPFMQAYQYQNMANLADINNNNDNENVLTKNNLNKSIKQKENKQNVQINSIQPLMMNGIPMNFNNLPLNIQSNLISGEMNSLDDDKQNELENTMSTKTPKNSLNNVINAAKNLMKNVPKHEEEYVTTNISLLDQQFADIPKEESDWQDLNANYVDNSIPNYGNQMLTKDFVQNQKDDHNYFNNLAKIEENGKNKSFIATQEELERASRWNDVLLNMNKFYSKRRTISL